MDMHIIKLTPSSYHPDNSSRINYLSPALLVVDSCRWLFKRLGQFSDNQCRALASSDQLNRRSTPSQWKIPARLAHRQGKVIEKIDAIIALPMAYVSAIQRGKVVNTGVWTPGGKRTEPTVDSSFDVMQVGLPGYVSNH
jgi:hypothetical protein